MKKVIIGILVMGLTGSAWAVTKAQLNDRIQSLNQQFTGMQQNPGTRVPAADLAKAQGIVLLDQTKGGLFFAYHSGDGIAMVKEPSGHWSAPAFVSTSGASLGVQAGGERDFFVILFMSPQAAHALTQQKVNLGAQFGGTGGNANYNAQANTASANSIKVFSAHHGVFGGASIKGGTLSADNSADAKYYGRTLSMSDILFNGQVQPTSTENNLIMKLSR